MVSYMNASAHHQSAERTHVTNHAVGLLGPYALDSPPREAWDCGACGGWRAHRTRRLLRRCSGWALSWKGFCDGFASRRM
ncbi:hypothetical protein N7462_006597 [Penicillium macrosclerotiorum]|uniref:uncharacterized protein n=1 Tax=Penicillium macrosclerotiorum TaxID=303699 RepID=UPI002547D54F|nr:uncharacterized protein N7462_006597 [Penicillium macrosclerotiorum]KAJ5683432.1 hypothetical protein N7462_006597 [Penicillium macrosclerotiorum]